MANGFIEQIIAIFGEKISPEILAFLISMLPVAELRGGLFAAKLMDIEFFKGFIICFLGNILPVPFILLFIRKIFDILKKSKKIEKLIVKLETRSIRKADKVKKYRLLGLFILVAIPLPGTGAWTGALVADLFDIRIKHSLPVIILGVFVAGIIVSCLSYGLLGALGF